MKTGSKISYQVIPLEHRLHLRQRFRDQDRENRLETIVFQIVNAKNARAHVAWEKIFSNETNMYHLEFLIKS